MEATTWIKIIQKQLEKHPNLEIATEGHRPGDYRMLVPEFNQVFWFNKRTRKLYSEPRGAKNEVPVLFVYGL